MLLVGMQNVGRLSVSRLNASTLNFALLQSKKFDHIDTIKVFTATVLAVS
jgi:hypothetical protein